MKKSLLAVSITVAIGLVAPSGAYATNDTSFGSQWSLENTGQTVNGTPGTPDADMDVPEAWATSTGAGATVAIVDSGIQFAHSEFSGQIASNPGEIAGNGVDDDANGFIDDTRGWDFTAAYPGDNSPDDGYSHGSAGAGIIGAKANNSVGIAGIAYGAKILPVRVLDNAGSGYAVWASQGMDYAGKRGANVVSVALGFYGLSASQVKAYFTDVITKYPKTLFVVGAGNSSIDNDDPTKQAQPCSLDLPNVICTSASTNLDTRYNGMSYGDQTVDVYAPGRDVYTTGRGNDYRFFSATSAATAEVSGVAALLYGKDPTLIGTEARKAIMDGVDAKPAFAGFSVTGGRANAKGALDAMPVRSTPVPFGAASTTGWPTSSYLAALGGGNYHTARFTVPSDGIGRFGGAIGGTMAGSFRLMTDAYTPVTTTNSEMTGALNFANFNPAVSDGGFEVMSRMNASVQGDAWKSISTYMAPSSSGPGKFGINLLKPTSTNHWGSATLLGEFTPGSTWQRFRIRLQGTSYKMRIWAEGTTEPTAWTAEATLAATDAAAGRSGFGMIYANNKSVDIKDVRIATVR